MHFGGNLFLSIYVTDLFWPWIPCRGLYPLSFWLPKLLQESFSRAKKWVQELQKQGMCSLVTFTFCYLFCGCLVFFWLLCLLVVWWFIIAGNPNMVMALAGNKADLEDRRSVSAEVSVILVNSMSPQANKQIIKNPSWCLC